jgi:hypothetical protein
MKKAKINSGILHEVKAKEEAPKETLKEETKELSETPKETLKENKPVREQSKLVRIMPYCSFIIILDHENICSKVGQCTCTLSSSGLRLPKTLHIVAGVSLIVPNAVTETKQLQDLRRNGKVVIKRL